MANETTTKHKFKKAEQDLIFIDRPNGFYYTERANGYAAELITQDGETLPVFVYKTEGSAWWNVCETEYGALIAPTELFTTRKDAISRAAEIISRTSSARIEEKRRVLADSLRNKRYVSKEETK